MNNVMPMFRKAPAPFAPAPVVETTIPDLRTFLVTLCFDGQTHHKIVDAFKSADAISTALNEFFNGECEMPDVMSMQAYPVDVLRAA